MNAWVPGLRYALPGMTMDFSGKKRSGRQFDRVFLLCVFLRLGFVRRQFPSAPELKFPPFLHRFRLEAQAELGAEAIEEKRSWVRRREPRRTGR